MWHLIVAVLFLLLAVGTLVLGSQLLTQTLVLDVLLLALIVLLTLLEGHCEFSQLSIPRKLTYQLTKLKSTFLRATLRALSIAVLIF